MFLFGSHKTDQQNTINNRPTTTKITTKAKTFTKKLCAIIEKKLFRTFFTFHIYRRPRKFRHSTKSHIENSFSFKARIVLREEHLLAC